MATRTYSSLIDYPHPVPTQQIDLIPGSSTLSQEQGSMSFTVLKGEQEFQPFEHVQLSQNGKLVGIGQVTTYSYHRMNDVTEVNFLILAFEIDGGLYCLNGKEVTEEFIKTPAATFLLSSEPLSTEGLIGALPADEDEEQ